MQVFTEGRAAEDAISSMNGRTLPHESERLVVEVAGSNKKKRAKRSKSRSEERRSPKAVEDVCYNCNKGGHW